MKPVRLAIVGATGMIGQTTLAVLNEWQVPLAELRLYASSESSGKTMKYGSTDLRVEALNEQIDTDYAILALGANLALDWAPRLSARGIRVIDHSSAHRMNENVPLMIPEINAHTLTNGARLVSNPNCSASVILMALAPLEREIGLERVICATYQSVSGAGIAAVSELRDQLLNAHAEGHVFPRRIAGNVVPEIGSLDTTDYTGEETKISQEIQKILERPKLHVTATAVRVPVEIGHAAAVSVELSRRAGIVDIEKILSSFSGLVNDKVGYFSPLEIAGRQEVHVGRVRLDPMNPSWLHFWVVGDNTRKGAASNAVQILQYWQSI